MAKTLINFTSSLMILLAVLTVSYAFVFKRSSTNHSEDNRTFDSIDTTTWKPTVMSVSIDSKGNEICIHYQKCIEKKTIFFKYFDLYS